MSERDVLERAAQALRAAHGGQSDDAVLTRVSVLMSVHRKRRRRLLGWVFWPPFCTLALAGSAWAQSAGKWAPLWQAMAAVVGLDVAAVEHTEAPPRVSSRATSPAPRASEPAAALRLDVPVEPVALPSQPVEAAPAPAAPSPAPRTRAPRRALEALTPAPREEPPGPAPTGAPREEIAPDPELQAFRAAHELHLRGHDPRAALDAHAAYLAAFPNGRFVPEARYATALDQLALGNKAAARASLAPFASGRYAGYRQKEAERLLEALR